MLPAALVDRFTARLNAWAMSTLGLRTHAPPWLSLYVNGCGQALHNDASNGQVGYVYSLTRWDARTFAGGETILFRNDDYWGTGRFRRAAAGTGLYDLVPSQFNRLLVFDDRVVHGVQSVQGTMDPLAGRVVLHGHLTADHMVLTGRRPADLVARVLKPVLDHVRDLAGGYAGDCHGFLTAQLSVDAGGQVLGYRPVCDRILPVSADPSRPAALRAAVEQVLRAVHFPPADGPSEVTVPVLVGQA